MMNDLFIYLTHQESHYIYALLFFVLTACGIGLPLPEDIPLIAAGYLAWRGDIDAVPAFLITMIAILIGDSLIFLLGKKLGGHLLNRDKPQFRFARPKKIALAERLFDKYGDRFVFFGRFVAGVRAVVFFFAGVLKMPYQRFMFFDGLAAFLSVPIWIALGFYLGKYFGDKIDEILASVKIYKNYFLIGLSSILAIVFLSFVIKLLRASKQA